MKKIILILLISFSAYSQKAIYNKTNKEGIFKEYQTKDGNIIKVGDTILIGYPQGSEFKFITQGNVGCASFLSNSKAVVSKIKSIGNTTRGFKTYACLKDMVFQFILIMKQHLKQVK
jgi:hypothetical protein